MRWLPSRAHDNGLFRIFSNGIGVVDPGTTPATIGPGVTYDPKQEQFVGEFAKQANALSRRDYRKPFVVPKLA